jgi:photosynthetic reaction center H subunit
MSMQPDRFDDVAGRDASLHGDGRNGTPRLVHLDEMSDLQVADGDPDIRGWDVRTADGEKVGTVKDLVVDTGLMKVRYIEARLNKEALNTSADRHVLIPIGSARLDDDEDDVVLSSSIVDPRTLPPYDRHSLSREYEVSLRERFPQADGTNPATSSSASGLADGHGDEEAFYRDGLYDDQRFFGERRRGRERSNYIGANSNGVIPRRHEAF